MNGNSVFDAESVDEQLSGVQKLALFHSSNFQHLATGGGNFRCVPGPPHGLHGAYGQRFCPEEVCGLMNCFPKLHEFYFVLLPRHDDGTQESVDICLKVYNTRE